MLLGVSGMWEVGMNRRRRGAVCSLAPSLSSLSSLPRLGRARSCHATDLLPAVPSSLAALLVLWVLFYLNFFHGRPTPLALLALLPSGRSGGGPHHHLHLFQWINSDKTQRSFRVVAAGGGMRSLRNDGTTTDRRRKKGNAGLVRPKECLKSVMD